MSVILFLIALPLILIALILFLSYRGSNTKGGKSDMSEVGHRFSFTSLCVFAAIAAMCAFLVRNDIKKIFVLKNDYANGVVISGEITEKWKHSGRHIRPSNDYKYVFIFDGEKKHGRFGTFDVYSFTKSYEKGESIDILYNKRINFFYPKDALKGEIAYCINSIMLVSFILWNFAMGFLWIYKRSAAEVQAMGKLYP